MSAVSWLALAAALHTASAYFSGFNTQLPEAVFIYIGEARNERDLPTCPPMGACNVIHKRFWMPPIVQRICRCPERMECPMGWSDARDRDQRTMPLDNRSQLKFCQNVRQLPPCSSHKPALTETNRTEPASQPSPDGTTRLLMHTMVTASCFCHKNRYWKHLRSLDNDFNNGTVERSDIYSCSKLEKCKPQQFCGHIRADYYSSYYRCSCPTGHMCVFHDRRAQHVNELLFRGKAYRGMCFPL